MSNIQIIGLDGLPAAIVIGDETIITERVSGADRVHIQAKALYAIAIRSGTRSGPYTDDGAKRHAATAAAQRRERSLRAGRRRGASRHGCHGRPQ
jgi:hypothetical protein